MTGDTRTSGAREAECGIRYAIVGVFVAGFQRRNPGAVVSAVVALAATRLPGLVERQYDVEFRPWQRLYAETAMLTHAVGMLGPYDDVWWWDRLAHTHSSTLLGGIIHAAARRRGRDPTPRVLVGVVGSGLLWEFLEYAVHSVSRRVGLDPLLVAYGPDDTFFDLVYNLLGALLVVAFGDRLLRNFDRRDDER